MALSIAPLVAWDLTSATTPLVAKVGEPLTLTQTGGTLDTNGFLVSANNHFLSTTATANMQSVTSTFVTCLSFASNVDAFVTIGGIFNTSGDQWAAALQTWDDGASNVFAGRINGSVGGRFSSYIIAEDTTEAVLVCSLGSSVAKIFVNQLNFLEGLPSTIVYGAVNTIFLNRVGINSGTTMKFAAFYDAELTAGDLTALGSNAASAYSAIFDGQPSTTIAAGGRYRIAGPRR